MGSLCCCLSGDQLEEYVQPYQRDCPCCVRCCMRWFYNTHYTSNFDEVEHEENILPIQTSTSTIGGAALGGSSSNSNNVDTMSVAEVFQAPPPPLPYDSDPRYLPRIARDGLISRKSGSSHSNSSSSDGTAMQRRFNGGSSDHEELLKSSESGTTKSSSVLSSSSKAMFPRVESNLSMLSDDDVCPTCLDGYTEENPRITTACGHNFHLACIYEWMERSKRCPLCDKEMIFSESL